MQWFCLFRIIDSCVVGQLAIYLHIAIEFSSKNIFREDQNKSLIHEIPKMDEWLENIRLRLEFHKQ